MCKRSCCCHSNSREGAGIAAIAVIAAGAIVAVKIGPIVARIIHLAVEVFTIIMLTAATALTCIVVGWLTVRIVRVRARVHRRTAIHLTATAHVAGAGLGKSPLLVARAREAISDGAVVYAIDPGDRYEVPARSDDQDAR